jgi:hypothetical protein
MARIRIVDDWLRCPAAPPSHWRSVMVVAEQWAEQRVLMRAYAESVDQTRPTIVLHGQELAIGPAGTDPHGPWGIHVQPPADGRAQELAQQLELAARRMAGTRGNPPRLADEPSAFERKRTNNWAPGSPRALPDDDATPYFEPQIAASQRMPSAPPVPPQLGFGTPLPAERVPAAPAAQYLPTVPAAERVADAPAAASGSALPPARVPRRRGWTSPVPPSPTTPVGRTALGYTSGSGAQSAVIRLGLRPAVAARLARIVERTVPADFEVTQAERDVLNALGERGQLTARAIAAIIGGVGGGDALAWMDRLMDKLGRHGLDIVVPGEPADGEPTYLLSH